MFIVISVIGATNF
jgi:hypothetical protein